MTENNQYQAALEVKFGVHYNAANEKFYNRLKIVFDVITIASGSSAFAGVLAQIPHLTAAAGIVIAVITAIGIAVSPGATAARFNEIHRRFTALEGRTAGMTAAAIRSEISAIRVDAPTGLRSINPVAYNRCLQANGYGDGFVPLNAWQKLFEVVA